MNYIKGRYAMNLEEAIKLYRSVGHRNADFLFNWLHNVYLKVYLPCIDINYRDTLALDKTKMTIFDVLADDLADNYTMRNEKLLEKFIQIPWSSTSINNEYLNVGRKMWEDCIASIKKYPRFKEFKGMFYFDLRQVLSAMEYSFLVNTMGLDNSLEIKIYPPHGCMVLLHCDMDLMCSPTFDTKDLGNMRAVFYLAQKIAHIGNMLNTYPREVLESDFSCPLISLALRKGLIKKEELKDEYILPKIKKLEPLFKKEAETYIKKVKEYENKIQSVDIRGFSETLCGLLDKFISRSQYWKTLEK